MDTVTTEYLSLAIASLIFGGGSWYYYRNYLAGGKEPKKITALKITLSVVGAFEAFNAGFAGADDHEHMPLGLRVGIHICLLIINTVMTFGIWKEMKEAFQALEDFKYLADETVKKDFRFVVELIWNFIMEWVQVIMVGGTALFAISINMYLMGVATGELIQVHAATSHILWFVDCPDDYAGWSFMEIVNEMSVPVAGNFFLSCLHVVGILVLGLLSRDKKLNIRKIQQPGAPQRINFDQVLGYYSKWVSAQLSTGSKVDVPTLNAMLDIDQANRFNHELQMEDMFIQVKAQQEIVDDLTAGTPARTAANAEVLRIRGEMASYLIAVEDQAKVITEGP